MPQRIPAVIAASAVLTAAVILGFPGAASAATVTTTTLDGLAFSADSSDIAAGATVTGYTGTGSTLDIPASVIIDGTSFAVTSIAGSQDPLSNGATIAGSFTTLVLPGTITDIGAWSFWEDTSLTSVHFGDAIVNIHDGAFEDDPLGAIVLPHSLNYVGAFVFLGAKETTLTLPEGLTDIEGQAFEGEDSLTTVSLPSTLTSLTSYVFNNDPALTTVLFLGGVPSLVVSAGANQSFDPSGGLVISYLWAHDAAQQTGGFTSPTWMGYNTRELVTVSFAADGFGAAPAAQRFAASGVAAQPADPTAAGEKFTGWFTSRALTTKADFADPVTADETLYAGWTSLAETGVSISPLAIPGALALLVLGVVLSLLARRRSRSL